MPSDMPNHPTHMPAACSQPHDPTSRALSQALLLHWPKTHPILDRHRAAGVLFLTEESHTRSVWAPSISSITVLLVHVLVQDMQWKPGKPTVLYDRLQNFKLIQHRTVGIYGRHCARVEKERAGGGSTTANKQNNNPRRVYDCGVRSIPWTFRQLI